MTRLLKPLTIQSTEYVQHVILSHSPVEHFIVRRSQCAETADEKENKHNEEERITFVDPLTQRKNLKNVVRNKCMSHDGPKIELHIAHHIHCV